MSECIIEEIVDWFTGKQTTAGAEDIFRIRWLIAELKQSRSNEEAITRSREGYAQQNEALAEELEKCEAEIKRLRK